MNFDDLEIGYLMAKYARAVKRAQKLLLEIEEMKRLIKENV